MGRRSLKAAPAAPDVDEQHDEDLDMDDASGADDDDLWDNSDGVDLDDLNDEGGAEGSEAEDAPPAVEGGAGEGFPPAVAIRDEDEEEGELTVRGSFTPLALQKLPGKMRDRPLSAQANDWIISTIGRLVDAQPAEDSPVRRDIAALIGAAEVREIAHMLSDHTLEEAYRLARTIALPEPVAEPVATPPAAAPIGVAAKLPGEPPVTGLVVELPISDVAPDPDQPRDEGADAEIGDEIRPDTVLPPIEVRAHPYAGQLVPNASAKPIAYPAYMIVDGERRYRGSLKAGRTTIRAIVNERPMDAGDLLLRQAALNQGKRLKPLEEARAWKRICDTKGWNASQLADYLKKPRSTVADRLAILDAPAPFQQLFLDGHLTAAAAPIVRQFAEVPAKVLERAIEHAQDNWRWEEAVAEGKAVPLNVVKEVLTSEICEEELAEIPPELRDRYTGESVRIGKKEYALNVDALNTLAEKHYQENASARDRPSSASPEKRAPSAYELEERKKRKALRKKAELRRAQFDVLSAKLPTSLAGGWIIVLLRWVVQELTNDTMRNAVKALGIEPPKKAQYGGYNFDKAIINHAEELEAPAQARLLLQLLLASDLYVASYSTGGADRFASAAKLLKVDLGKVKLPEPEKSAPAAAPGSKKKMKNGGGDGERRPWQAVQLDAFKAAEAGGSGARRVAVHAAAAARRDPRRDRR